MGGVGEGFGINCRQDAGEYNRLEPALRLPASAPCDGSAGELHEEGLPLRDEQEQDGQRVEEDCPPFGEGLGGESAGDDGEPCGDVDEA